MVVKFKVGDQVKVVNDSLPYSSKQGVVVYVSEDNRFRYHVEMIGIKPTSFIWFSEDELEELDVVYSLKEINQLCSYNKPERSQDEI